MSGAVPHGVCDEVERVVRRWQQLPLDRALAASGAVRALVDDLASRCAPGATRPPDLGPATLLDQLVVLVRDACLAGRAGDLEDRLGLLRRQLG